MEGRIVLRELYEQCYGIANHIESKNPLEIVLKQPNEDLTSYNPMANVAEQFARLGLYELYGIPFDKFIQLPTTQTKMLLKAANDRTIKERERAVKLDKETKKITG